MAHLSWADTIIHTYMHLSVHQETKTLVSICVIFQVDNTCTCIQIRQEVAAFYKYDNHQRATVKLAASCVQLPIRFKHFLFQLSCNWANPDISEIEIFQDMKTKESEILTFFTLPWQILLPSSVHQISKSSNLFVPCQTDLSKSVEICNEVN